MRREEGGEKELQQINGYKQLIDLSTYIMSDRENRIFRSKNSEKLIVML